jgi:hypothetical protein
VRLFGLNPLRLIGSFFHFDDPLFLFNARCGIRAPTAAALWIFSAASWNYGFSPFLSAWDRFRNGGIISPCSDIIGPCKIN